jgi:hypothetical protein
MEGYKIVRGTSTPPLSDMLPYPSLPFFLGLRAAVGELATEPLELRRHGRRELPLR